MKVIFVGGIIAAAASIAFFLSNNRKRKNFSRPASRYCKLVPVTSKSSSVALTEEVHLSEEELKVASDFLAQAMSRYEKKLLAYCILELAEEKNLSAEKKLELTEQFGLVSLAPMLSVEFADIKSSGLLYRDVERAANLWLKKNNFPICGGEPIESLENQLLVMKKREAAEILEKQLY